MNSDITAIPFSFFLFPICVYILYSSHVDGSLQWFVRHACMHMRTGTKKRIAPWKRREMKTVATVSHFQADLPDEELCIPQQLRNIRGGGGGGSPDPSRPRNILALNVPGQLLVPSSSSSSLFDSFGLGFRATTEQSGFRHCHLKDRRRNLLLEYFFTYLVASLYARA